jgi:hypothetical protein
VERLRGTLGAATADGLDLAEDTAIVAEIDPTTPAGGAELKAPSVVRRRRTSIGSARVSPGTKSIKTRWAAWP